MIKFKKYIQEKILKKVSNKLIDNNNKLKLVNFSIKIFSLIIIIILLINILSFSYKAFLYPIRTSQYFDECSYLAIGKYFRTISPIKIFSEFILKKKEIPRLYNEFNCRLIYWPIILSIPLKFTENKITLHCFRAILMTIGTLTFFLLGYKLTGFTGGIVSASFWIGTPLLNYWGHFFMSENPSFIFLVIGYYLLLVSDKFKITSFFGGACLGFAFLTRFTTSILIIPAPFILLAIFFNPFRRKNFQLFGEWAKAFLGFFLSIIPYFILTFYLFKNPFIAFQNAQFSVNYRPVNDSFYYLNNLWIEGGFLLYLGLIIALLAIIILSIAMYLKNLINTQNKTKLLTFNKNIENKSKVVILISDIKIFFNIYLKILGGSFCYYSIIIISLFLTTILYIFIVSEIPHKIPRYLSGSLIPLIIIASISFGSFESFFKNLFHLYLNKFILLFKKITKIKKIYIISLTTISFILCVSLIILLSALIWNKILNRPYTSIYKIPANIEKDLKNNNDIITLTRLQPEYNSWQLSLSKRLKKIKNNPKNKIDNSDYFNYWELLTYIQKIIKPDEVVYVDIFSQTPFFPAYAEFPCVVIDSYYNTSISKLIDSKELFYKGYILVFKDNDKNIIPVGGKIFIRSLTKSALMTNKNFKFVAEVDIYDIYYYDSKINFPYKFGITKNISFFENSSPNFTKDKTTENNIKKTGLKIYKIWKKLVIPTF